MFFFRLAVLLSFVVTTMTLSPPQHEPELTATDLRAFTTSLKLSSSNEARILDILTELGVNVSTEDDGRRKRTLPSRVLAGCWILRVVMGESVLYEEEDIQKAVSESWCVSCQTRPTVPPLNVG